MNKGILLLTLAYVLSQFFRAFLAVLAPVLKADLGTGPEALAFASGLWFLIFAAMQIPVGWALDNHGPRRTSAILLLLGGAGGATVFGLATSAAHINIAMALIGIGCSPVLMAAYYIFAREYPARQFATLAAVIIGVGSVGNLIASYPMALAADTLGWRAALFTLAAATAAVAAGIWVFVKDPAKPEGEATGSLFDVLKIRALWFIMPLMFVSYAPSGAIRGLWVGPYLSDTYALSTSQIGQATLVMGLAMILGTFVYGPLDKLFGTRKWVVFFGNAFGAAAIFGLATIPASSPAFSIALLATIGFFGASFPMLIAHGRGLFPQHLVGRGVTLLNLFGIGGAGLMQFASGRVHSSVPDGPYPAIFAFFGAALLVGLVIYAFSHDNMD